MSVFMAWGSVENNYPFEQLPEAILTDELRCNPVSNNIQVITRHRSRWIAHFLLWKLFEKAQLDTALLGKIYRGVNGRPELPAEDIDFNISHSGNFVAVIVNVKKKHNCVGIDIELPNKPNKKRNFEGLLRHFGSEEEWTWCHTQEKMKFETAFYNCWCLREAVLKAVGHGILKLSYVEHHPNTLVIRSDYCPKGQLIFDDSLGFYLAIFIQGKDLNNIQYFQWNGKNLEAFHLNNSRCYQVNP
ncbi:4'-phosphopantetheinyl transferase family protein [Pasteurella bettyae]|uniref:4'-phosphopantetheinyl transferase family protein n=2 Tax=Pasteurella bettyae TaxID=752 RepID=UPI003D271678